MSDDSSSDELKEREDPMSDDSSSDELADAILAAKPRAPERVVAALARMNVEQLEIAGQDLGGDPTVPWPRVGRYQLIERLGRGSMGEVWLGVDTELGRRVALKQLRPRSAHHKDRLRREAQALARLSHPNVVTVYGVEKDHDQLFIAMELIVGQTLQQWQEQRPAPGWADCVRAYIEAGRGLAAAHAAGLVHRDFKPSNCMIDGEGRVKVLDFGLVSQASADVLSSKEGEFVGVTKTGSMDVDDALSRSLTQAGALLGTQAYMAPEAMGGASVSSYSDQFSFFVSLYEALYASRPFAGDTRGALAEAVMTGRIQPAPKASFVPSRLRRILLRGLEVDAKRRWPSMDAVLVELSRLVASRTGRHIAIGALGVGLGGLLAVGAVAAHYIQVMHRCTGSGNDLLQIWGEESRQKVQEAILGTEVPYAEDTWERVGPPLDEYVDGLAAKHTEICEATKVRQEQSDETMDLRMRCLQERKIALQETVGVLMEADATRVENAVKLVEGLPRLSRCDEVEALQAELPPPEDPEVAIQVEKLRERLVQIRTFVTAGTYTVALTSTTALIEEAEELEYAPLLAEALLEHGVVLHELGQYEEAEQHVERAYQLALEHRLDRVEHEAVIQLGALVGIRQARHEFGLQWGKIALGLAKRHGSEPTREAESFNNIGTILYHQDRLEEALEHHIHALETWKAVFGHYDHRIASVLTNIGNVLRLQGRLEDALAYHQDALEVIRVTLGSRHPLCATPLNNIGTVLEDQGKLEDAMSNFRESLAIREEVLGPHHPEVADSLYNIGLVLRKQGKFSDALFSTHRALRILEETLGPSHPNVAKFADSIGTILCGQGKQGDALAYYQRALTIHEQARNSDGHAISQLLTNIGSLLQEQGKADDALSYHQRALAISEETLGPRHPDVAASLNNLANVLQDLGELAAAELNLQRALAIWEEQQESSHPGVPYALHNLGQVLLEQGRLDDALIQYQRALTIWEKTLGPRHQLLAYPLVGLTDVSLAKHDPDTARKHAERAVSIRESGETAPHLLAEARFALAQALWPDRSQRARACALAQQARDGFAELGEAKGKDLAEVKAWLAGRHVARSRAH